MQKQLEGTQYINGQLQDGAHIDGPTHAIIVSNTHASAEEYKCLK